MVEEAKGHTRRAGEVIAIAGDRTKWQTQLFYRFRVVTHSSGQNGGKEEPAPRQAGFHTLN
jgi:hypothetical protein